MAKKTETDNKAEILRQLSVNELGEKLVAARKELFDMRIKRSELKNPLKLRSTRRGIARILTLINEKEARSGAAETKKE
jgi:large subunit ribosomal protein L29